jgi:repressor LexA
VNESRRDYKAEVLRFVSRFMEANGYPPTYEEIAESVGLSGKSHVNYYLGALEEDGRIERKPRTPRGLRLVGQAPASFELRVEGNIAAGLPIEHMDGPAREIQITPDIADPRRDLYALLVRGDSMVDALVGDGDILVVDPSSEVSRGQMAVVHLCDSNQATLKHVYPEGELVRLQPAHPTMTAFYADATDVQIQGRVVAVIRRL